MNHRTWMLGAVLLGLMGCAHQQTRLQSADENDRDKEPEIKTIGDITAVGNADPIPVSGVGLVYGLEGTGGDPPSGSYRNLLEHQLQQHGVEHVKDVLASSDTSMVMVTALIPPGVHKGDPLDIEITLPPQSKTTSLRGGYLRECFLFNYDTTKNLSPNFGGSNALLLGQQYAKAEGPLLVGFGDGDEQAKLRQGRIWGGGRSKIERPFYLIFNSDQQRAPVVQRAADRINETFHGPNRGALSDVATAKTSSYLVLRIPEQYKYNLPRYLRVVRLIPLREAPPANSPYRRRLEEELLDPAHTVTAALRLEALGSESIPALKRGLQSSHVLVRFTAAEAMAYLGNPSCGEELAALVEHQPMLRAFGLTAMASLDEAISHVKLRDLMAAPTAETRYGAFRALRVLDDHDPAVKGEYLNNSFWLHHVAPDSTPLVHLATRGRPELVLFGEDVYLVPPFSFLAGEFTITASHDDSQCILSRMSSHHGTSRRQSSLKLEDVVRCLADMGGMYPEVVELLHQIGQYQCLKCPVAVDALPQAVSVYDLAKGGKGDPGLQKTEQEILKAQREFGATPNLYDKSGGKRPRKEAHDDIDSQTAASSARSK
jgi:hypothetical protein